MSNQILALEMTGKVDVEGIKCMVLRKYYHSYLLLISANHGPKYVFSKKIVAKSNM